MNKPNNGKDYNQYGTHGISSKFYMRDIASGDFNNIRNIGVMCGNIDGYYYWIGLVKGVTLEEAQSLIDGTQIVYELATPTELTLTPAQLELLKGNNTITANGASISLTYQPDNLMGEVMEQVEPQIEDLQEQVNGLAEDVADVQSGLSNKIGYIRIDVSGTEITTLENGWYYANISLSTLPSGAVPISVYFDGGWDVDVFYSINMNAVVARCLTSKTIGTNNRYIKVLYYIP